MRRDHLFGYPAALTAVEPAPTAPRYPLGRPTRDPEPAPVWPFPAAPKKVFVPDSRTPDSDKPPREAKLVDPVEAALRERFKIGDRVRVVGYMRPGSLPYGDGDEGVVVGFNLYYVKCHMDRNLRDNGTCPVTHWGTEDRPGGCIELIRQPEKPAQAEPKPTPQPDADGWIAHTDRQIPAHLKPGMRVDIRWTDGSEFDAVRLVEPAGNGWSCSGLRISAYRVVSA